MGKQPSAASQRLAATRLAANRLIEGNAGIIESCWKGCPKPGSVAERLELRPNSNLLWKFAEAHGLPGLAEDQQPEGQGEQQSGRRQDDATGNQFAVEVVLLTQDQTSKGGRHPRHQHERQSRFRG